MKRLLTFFAVAVFSANACAETLWEVSFTNDIPTMSSIAGAISNAVSEIGQGSINTQSVIDIVNGMDIRPGLDTNAVIDIVSDYTDSTIRQAVDDYIEQSGSAAVIDELFDSAKNNYISSIGGRAYGLEVAEAVSVVVRSDKVSFNVRVSAYSPEIADGSLEIIFDRENLLELLEQTYYTAEVPRGLSDVARADLVFKQLGLGDLPVVKEERDVIANLLKSDYSVQRVAYRQINGTTVDGYAEGVSSTNAVLVLFEKYVPKPSRGNAFRVALIYTPSAANELGRKLFEATDDSPIVLDPGTDSFFYVCLSSSGHAYTDDWSDYSNFDNKFVVYSLTYDGTDYPAAYMKMYGNYDTNTVPYGPMSPVITEWHLNRVSNDWNNIVASTIESGLADEREFFSSNVVASTELLNTVSNVFFPFRDSFFDTVESWSNAVQAVSGDVSVIEAILDSAVSSRLEYAETVLDDSTNSLARIERGVEVTERLYDDITNRIVEANADTEQYVTNSVKQWFNALNDSIFVVSNVEMTAVKDAGVRLGFPITYAPTSSVVQLFSYTNALVDDPDTGYVQDSLVPQTVYIDFSEDSLVSLTNFLSGKSTTVNGKSYGSGWTSLIIGGKNLNNGLYRTDVTRAAPGTGVKWMLTMGQLIDYSDAYGSEAAYESAYNGKWCRLQTPYTFNVHRVFSDDSILQKDYSGVRLIALPQTAATTYSAGTYNMNYPHVLNTLQSPGPAGVMMPNSGCGLSLYDDNTAVSALKTTSIPLSVNVVDGTNRINDIVLPLIIDVTLSTGDDSADYNLEWNRKGSPRLGLLLRYSADDDNYVSGFDTLLDYIRGKADFDELYERFIKRIRWFVTYATIHDRMTYGTATVPDQKTSETAYEYVLDASKALNVVHTRCAYTIGSSHVQINSAVNATNRNFNSGIFLYDYTSAAIDGTELNMKISPLGETVNYRRTVTSYANLDDVIENKLNRILDDRGEITRVITNVTAVAYTNDRVNEAYALDLVKSAIDRANLAGTLADANSNMAAVVSYTQEATDRLIGMIDTQEEIALEGGYLTSNAINRLVIELIRRYAVTNGLTD